MNAVTSIIAANPASPLPEPPPVVLRFDGLHPADLGRVRMHDKRTGGDLSHVDPNKTRENRVEFGDAGWIETLRFEIAQASKSNLENHVAALDKKSRKKEIVAVKDAGLQDPWRRCKHGPLREGILRVNKAWFGGSGHDAWEAGRIEAFRTHAKTFLEAHFPDGQLRHASSHADEEAFHLHFVVAVWTEKVTANRGVQHLLQASMNPLLADYEHAQDLAGVHFEEIGLQRGERHAAARRAARAEDATPDPTRRHVPPSAFRAEIRRKAQAEKAEILRDASAEADGIRANARTMGEAAIRKSRKRAVREANERKAAAGKVEATAARRRDEAAEIARREEEAAHAARLQKKEMEEGFAALAARAKAHVEAAEAAAAKVQTLKAEAVGVEAELVGVRGELQAVVQKKAVVENAAGAAEIRKKQADDEAMAARIAQTMAEDRAAQTMAKASQVEVDAAAESERMGALAEGVEFLANDVLTWRTAEGDSPAKLTFGAVRPADAADRQRVADTVKLAGPWLRRIAQLVRTTVDAVLRRERRQLAQDARELAALRSEMGLAADERLDRIRRGGPTTGP